MNKEKSKWQRMGELTIRSDEWFAAAFEDMEDVPDFCKQAAKSICNSYPINGQCDPGYIANTIHRNYNESQGIYQVHDYCMYINKNQRNPPNVTKVIATPDYFEVKESKGNVLFVQLNTPITKLVQVGESLQLFWADWEGNPTSLSYFWLTELITVPNN